MNSIDVREVLRCPKCSSSLNDRHNPTGEQVSALSCPHCAVEYPIVRGVPRFAVRHLGGQTTDTLQSFNFQYGKESWIFDYDIKRVKRILNDVFRISKDDIQGKSVCIVGCGNGCEASVLNSYDPSYIVGIDLTAAIEDAAQNTSQCHNVIVVQADAVNPPLEHGSIDILYCDGVLPHTENPAEFLAGILQLVAPGGVAHVRTLINHGDLRSNLAMVPRNALRVLTRRLPNSVWWYACYVIGVFVRIPVIGRMLAKGVFHFDREDMSVKVTQLINFRFYGNHQYRHRISKQELIDVVQSAMPDAHVNVRGPVLVVSRDDRPPSPDE